ncbi:hypothetical protein C4D60_Mb04t29650 [Musa balbisiana]|uniref:Uncharacterized protein n=1 Tax=Musa balbisiana TaxID=52838 RepID=A0A4S8KG62_MUSBA|nr:hypothetical protein C4D60_Mb04t29650 [Musa balbisiana]
MGLAEECEWACKQANLTFPASFFPRYIYPAPVSGVFVTEWLFGTVAFPMLQKQIKQEYFGAGLSTMRYADGRRRGGLVTLVCFSAMFWMLVSPSICSEQLQGTLSGVSGCVIFSSGGSKNCLGNSSPTKDANPPPTSTDPYKKGVNPPVH